MNNVNKTLYIPLYGKALVSKKGIILSDKKAETIWESVQFPLNGKSKSKWLAYYMGMRSAVFDNWLLEKREKISDCVILHLGCGLDARAERVGVSSPWYDVDFPSVIEERKKFYEESELYKMLSSDIREGDFLKEIEGAKNAVVVMEGVSMYLTNEELKGVFVKLKERFENVSVLVDCYTPFAAKMSKIKNPIRGVGVTKVYGVASPSALEGGRTGLRFSRELEITPKEMIEELEGRERCIFKTLYAGKTSKKLYKLYEYEGNFVE